MQLRFPLYLLVTAERELVVEVFEQEECLLAFANVELVQRYVSRSPRRLAWIEVTSPAEYCQLLLELGNDVPFISWRTASSAGLARLLRVSDECRRMRGEVASDLD